MKRIADRMALSIIIAVFSLMLATRCLAADNTAVIEVSGTGEARL